MLETVRKTANTSSARDTATRLKVHGSLFEKEDDTVKKIERMVNLGSWFQNLEMTLGAGMTLILDMGVSDDQ